MGVDHLPIGEVLSHLEAQKGWKLERTPNKQGKAGGHPSKWLKKKTATGRLSGASC